jgi:hypothetical protein
MFKPPKEDSRYSWTSHVSAKMQQYGISESRIKRIVRYPTRIEEGIAEDTIAVMCPYGTSPAGRQPGGRPYTGEIWVMYKLQRPETRNKKPVANNKKPKIKDKKPEWKSFQSSSTKIKVITAWRYPGVSSKRDPVPEEIIREVQRLL